MSEIEVPKGWQLSKISEVGKIITGSTPNTKNSEFYGDDFPFYKPADLDSGDIISISRNGLSKEGIKHARFLQKNSILVTCIGSIGKSSMINKPGACNQQLNAITVNEEHFLPKFIFYWIKSNSFQNLMNRYANSTTLPIINKSKFKNLPVIYPDIKTQNKIIQKLDYVLGQLEEKKKTLSEIANKNENRINLIYEQIDGEIITKYFESQEVRENSVYHTFEDVCILNPPKSELTNFNENMEVSFVPMRTVDDVEGVIKTPEIRRLKEVKKGYTYFRENDVIFAKITPCMENGKSAIGKNLKNKIGFGSTEFHVLRPKDMVLSEWIYYFVRQNKFRKHAELVMSGSAGQQRVPISFIKSYEIPIPDIRIQKKIIEEIKNSRKSVLQIQDNIQPLFNRLKNSNEYLNQLNNSILDKAFSGKLVN